MQESDRDKIIIMLSNAEIEFRYGLYLAIETKEVLFTFTNEGQLESIRSKNQ